MRGPTIRRYHASCSLALCKSLLLNLKSVDGFLLQPASPYPLSSAHVTTEEKSAFANNAFI